MTFQQLIPSICLEYLNFCFLNLFRISDLEFRALKAGSKPAHYGVVMEQFGVLLDIFGVVWAHFGVILDYFGNIKTPKSTVSDAKTQNSSRISRKLPAPSLSRL